MGDHFAQGEDSESTPQHCAKGGGIAIAAVASQCLPCADEPGRAECNCQQLGEAPTEEERGIVGTPYIGGLSGAGLGTARPDSSQEQEEDTEVVGENDIGGVVMDVQRDGRAEGVCSGSGPQPGLPG